MAMLEVQYKPCNMTKSFNYDAGIKKHRANLQVGHPDIMEVSLNRVCGRFVTNRGHYVYGQDLDFAKLGYNIYSLPVHRDKEASEGYVLYKFIGPIKMLEAAINSDNWVAHEFWEKIEPKHLDDKESETIHKPFADLEVQPRNEGIKTVEQPKEADIISRFKSMNNEVLEVLGETSELLTLIESLKKDNEDLRNKLDQLKELLK
jgi:hypothetical protein